MATSDHDPFQGFKFKPEAAKPTSIPTVMLGMRELLLELCELVIEGEFVSVSNRPRLLALTRQVMHDGAEEKWAREHFNVATAGSQLALDLEEG